MLPFALGFFFSVTPKVPSNIPIKPIAELPWFRGILLLDAVGRGEPAVLRSFVLFADGPFEQEHNKVVAARNAINDVFIRTIVAQSVPKRANAGERDIQ
jgi:hypothetical protein